MGRTSDARERLMKAVAELIWIGSYGSTTIDHICAQAGVRKGTFYHFFESKSDLACAAIVSEWEVHKGRLDHIFSPTRPPLERLSSYCRHCHEEQVELKKRYGYVLGCPLLNLGTEVSTQEDRLRQIVEDIMSQALRYLTSTVTEAQAAGLIEPGDPSSRARILYAYQEGLLSQARIHNNTEILLEMEMGSLEILRLKPQSPARSASRSSPKVSPNRKVAR